MKAARRQPPTEWCQIFPASAARCVLLSRNPFEPFVDHLRPEVHNHDAESGDAEETQQRAQLLSHGLAALLVSRIVQLLGRLHLQGPKVGRKKWLRVPTVLHRFALHSPRKPCVHTSFFGFLPHLSRHHEHAHQHADACSSASCKQEDKAPSRHAAQADVGHVAGYPYRPHFSKLIPPNRGSPQTGALQLEHLETHLSRCKETPSTVLAHRAGRAGSP